MVIAIDGLSTNGKSTLAEKIAKELHFQYFNTGAIYRCLALEIINQNYDVSNIDETLLKLKNVDISFDDKRVLMNEEDVTDTIRTELVTMKSTEWALIPGIKSLVLDIQQKFLKEHDTVMEGRDICTRVAPNADVKFYLYADFDTRVERLWSINKSLSIEKVRENLIQVDDMDIHGGLFIKPEDAFEIDTTNLSIDQVYEEMMGHIHLSMNAIKKLKYKD